MVVTERLDWRLHALDLTSEVTSEQPPEALRSHGFLVADQYKPEEVRKGAWDALRGAPPWCVRLERRGLAASSRLAQGGRRLGGRLLHPGDIQRSQANAHRGAAGACQSARGAAQVLVPSGTLTRAAAALAQIVPAAARQHARQAAESSLAAGERLLSEQAGAWGRWLPPADADTACRWTQSDSWRS